MTRLSRKKAYEAILRELLAYVPKALGRGQRRNRCGDCCVIGVYALGVHGDVDAELDEIGGVAGDVMTENDSFVLPSAPPDENQRRYRHMVEWLKKEIEACP